MALAAYSTGDRWRASPRDALAAMTGLLLLRFSAVRIVDLVYFTVNKFTFPRQKVRSTSRS
jgi:hypothetical protein